MLVSIVIVTRNRLGGLLEALKSVYRQDYPHMEVIIVDNASTDGTSQQVLGHYPQAVLLTQKENTGAAGGRNIGIRHARGEVCISFDDDAELAGADAVSRTVEYFRRDPRMACLSFLVCDKSDNVVTKLIPRRDRKLITEDTPAAMFSGTGFAFRRSFFIEAGGFWEKLNPYFGEEPDLSYRIIDMGYHIMYTPHIKVRHEESPYERPRDRRLYYGVRNAPWMALRSLPWSSVFSLTILSWGYFFLIAMKENQLGAFFHSIMESIKGFPDVYRQRRPISPESCRIIRKYSGLISY
jgi:GT2 family glycosyltransferase